MPTISVIIPTYKGAAHVGAAIESVLAQTYRDFELLVVSDASPDNTTQIVEQYTDPRLHYIVHEKNRGADRARYTGLHASSGQIIAFLDQDDRFHKDKLHAHVSLLEKRPNIGLTYNDRFELNYSSETIRDLWRPPRTMSVADLVLWFPLGPSDVVIRRPWAERMDLISSTRGAEISHFSQLMLDGCEFACVERALNYRRYHSRRVVGNVAAACSSEIDNQNKVLTDPRCPPNVVALRSDAHSNVYMYWAYVAFAQQDTSTGQKLIRQALKAKPSIVEGHPGALVRSFLINCIDDENLDHGQLWNLIVGQLPPEMAWLSEWTEWIIARGYLLKGTRAIVWDRLDDGARHFAQAVKLGAQVDESYLGNLTYQVLSYEEEFGADAVNAVVHNLAPHIRELGGSASIRQLESQLVVDRAFRRYHRGEYRGVSMNLLRTLMRSPNYMSNAGVWSVLVRSALAR